MEDRTKKEKKIHNAETHIRELQSSINMIKIFVLLTIMDITQSVDPRNNIFLELMNMSRNALFAGKNVCMPHAPSVGAGIPWVAHPISKCDTCTLFDIQQGYMSQRNNSSSFFVLHSWTTILQPNLSCRLSIKSEACRILYRNWPMIRFWPWATSRTLLPRTR